MSQFQSNQNNNSALNNHNHRSFDPLSSDDLERLSERPDEQEISDLRQNAIQELLEKEIKNLEETQRLLDANDPNLAQKHRENILNSRRKIYQYENERVSLTRKIQGDIDQQAIAKETVEGLKAHLKPWETNKNLYLLNILGGWFIKSGLSTIHIVSLLTIIGVKNLQQLEWGSASIFAIFSGLCIVYGISFATYEWVISENKDTIDEDKFITIHWLNKKIRKLEMFCVLVFLGEILLGYALIPNLLEKQQQQLLAKGIEIPKITGWDNFKIMFGVSLFAFTNLWWSVSKGRRFMFTTQTRQKLNQAKAKHSHLQIQIVSVQGRAEECGF